jgi:hypothetical protein
MSFEGYYQFLCKNGHSREEDAHQYFMSSPEEDFVCDICEEGLAWIHLVDTTNGSFCDCPAGEAAWFGIGENNEEPKSCGDCDNGMIDGFVELKIATPAKIEKCNLGHDHVLEEPTFKVPTDRGRRVTGANT